jgi:hypothetical protein
MTPSGTRGVLNDAVSIYLLRSGARRRAVVARLCIGYRVETADGAFRVREDEPGTRVGAGLPSTLNLKPSLERFVEVILPIVRQQLSERLLISATHNHCSVRI